MSGSKRIALYGGTFDPVHRGHIAVAQRLSGIFTLDIVLFIPAYLAPHKRVTKVTPAIHRYAMLALATQDEARFRISTIELDAPEKPYTFETISSMQDSLRRDAEIFFVMGADSWMEITTWREWEKVLALSNHIVVTRPGYELSAAPFAPEFLERIVDLRGKEKEDAAQVIGKSSGPMVYLTDAVNADVSATSIRRAVRERRENDWLPYVQPTVADYIRKYELYGEA